MSSDVRSIHDHLVAAVELAVPRVRYDVPVRECAGLVLADDAIAEVAVPPFDNSAMDGFIVHCSDLQGDGPWELPVAGDIPAGSRPVDVPAGHAVRIMTGAPSPTGEGTEDLIVVPVEQTNIPRGPVPLPETVVIEQVDTSRAHLRRAGSNVQPGEVAATKGSRVDAGTIAALISLGVDEVNVFAAPIVAVISTGAELVERAEDAEGHQIPDSNLPMLAALAAANGAGQVLEFHADDDNDAFRDVLSQAVAQADIIVTSGGVSVGAFDVVRAVTEESSEMWFGQVAQRPGEPQGLGWWAGTPLVCLPGNPVAAFNSFHAYMVPLMQATAGLDPQQELTDRPHVRVRVDEDFPAPHQPVTLMVPVKLDFSAEGVTATPFSSRGHSSHLVGSLVNTNGLAVVEYGDTSDERLVLLTRT
ncbi:gephyrin-like molybdotransferase Glp [Corynebacterium pilosum]|uniref:Molybdopterin molybdenumtransferase n=1 Tax=Corynebacterium pilosum TaxID=35756 RepID=A0A376CRF4_9CORY|nr:gephyrin-like molybdotransferase Glp [Corynebacterium pilosum]STC70218.1 molybdopterin biosynthesis protein MoeA [Corynebacterium pilosum]